MRRHFVRFLTSISTLSLSSVALADSVVVSDWQPWEDLPAVEKQGIAPYCPGGFVAQPLQAEDNDVQTFRFNQGQIVQGQQSTLSGQVNILGPQLQTQADEVTYNPDGVSQLSGNVNLRIPGVAFSTDSAEISLENYYAKLKQAEFVLPGQDMHGQAGLIERPDQNRFEATDIAFTRCAPESNAWRIRSSRLEIDNDEQIARAWHSRLEVQNIPVLYLPYVSFPLNDQPRTGFLIPTFGSGYYQEYYVHLASNYDATLAANYLNNQGLFGGAEFRFLTEDHNGITNVGAELLTTSDSETANNSDVAPERSRYSIQHRQSGQLFDAIGYDLSTRWVSDKNYDVDITAGNNTVVDYNKASLKLNGRPFAANTSLGWDFRTPVSDSSKLFDELDTRFSVSNNPYSMSILQERRWAHTGDAVALSGYGLVRKPQVNLGWRPSGTLLGVNLKQTAQYTAFQRDYSDQQIESLAGVDRQLATRTQRTNTNTQLSRALNAGPVTITPTLEGLYAYYWRDNPTDLSIGETYGTRSVHQPTWRSSLDLTSTLPLQGERVKQELKPRVYWAYAPYFNQTGPVLDSEAEDSFTLFSRARFTSVDRIGDLNRLSTQLNYSVSPVESAYPALSTSLSKGVKLTQERLQLNDSAEPDPDWVPEYSPWVLSGQLKPIQPLTLTASADLEHDQSEFTRFNLGAEYRPSERIFANIDWTRESPTEHTLTAGAYLPVLQNVAFIGYGEMTQDLDDQTRQNYEPTELLMGLDIDSCCWNIRFALLETRRADDEEGTSFLLENSSIAPYFEVTLKGIGAGVGTIENILEQLDFGYAGRLFNTR